MNFCGSKIFLFYLFDKLNSINTFLHKPSANIITIATVKSNSIEEIFILRFENNLKEIFNSFPVVNESVANLSTVVS